MIFGKNLSVVAKLENLTRSAALAVALLVLGAPVAAASEQVFYSSGRAFTLNKSSDEFVVEYASSQKFSEMAARLEGKTTRSMRRVPWLPVRSPIGVVSVPRADATTRGELLRTEGVVNVQPLYRTAGSEHIILVTGRIAVGVKPELTGEQVLALAAEYGLEYERPISGLLYAHVFRAPPGAPTDCVEKAARLFDDPRTTFAHPDARVQMESRQVGTTDPFYPMQWHLVNDGSEGGEEDADIDADEAWAVTMGAGSVLAVVDDAIDWQHEDLAGAFRAGLDIGDGGFDPSPKRGPDDDPFGLGGEAHGTAVAGLALARANGVGIRGVAPEAQLVAIRFLAGSFIDQAEAITFANAKGVQVINASWGSFIPNFTVSDIVENAIRNVAREGRNGLGCIVVFAIGNNRSPVFDDVSTLPEVMSVGATLRDDTVACYSNFGPYLSLVAPGGGSSGGECFFPDMVTTDVTGEDTFPTPGYNPSDDFVGNLSNFNYHNQFSGTSAAAPLLSGTACLVLSVNPSLTRINVRNLLEHTADRIQEEDANYHPITSQSLDYGYGRLNARNAVVAAQESLVNGGLTWPSPVGDVLVRQIGANVRLGWFTPPDAVNVLVVQSPTNFEFVPLDGVGYAVDQEVAPDVKVISNALAQEVSFNLPENLNFSVFGIYTQNAVGRWSWGVSVNTNGFVIGDSRDNAEPPPVSTDPGSMLYPPTPNVTVRATPTIGFPPLLVTFNASALTDSPIANIVWDFGDGQGSTEKNVLHTYEQSGDYVATCTITDQDGDAGQAGIGVTVSRTGTGPVNPATARIIASPTSGSAPLAVGLSAVTENFTGSNVVFLWDLGDGNVATGQSVDHIYTFAGSFSVAVVINDDQGSSATASTVVTVRPGASNGNTNANTNGNGNANDNSGGGGGVTCGPIGAVSFAGFLVGMALIAVVRRK